MVSDAVPYLLFADILHKQSHISTKWKHLQQQYTMKLKRGHKEKEGAGWIFMIAAAFFFKHQQQQQQIFFTLLFSFSLYVTVRTSKTQCMALQ